MWILSRNGDEQTRGRHERVSSQDIPPDTPTVPSLHEQQPHNNDNNDNNTTTIPTSTIEPEIPTAEAISVDENDGTSSLLEGEAVLVPDQGVLQRHQYVAQSLTQTSREATNHDSTQGQNEDDEADEHSSSVAPSDEMLRLSAEREIHRRKSSTCFIIVGLILFRLWVEALIQGDIALIIIVSIISSYFIGWMKHRRAVQHDFQERIEALREEQRRTAQEEEDDTELGRTTRRGRDESGGSRSMNGSSRGRRMRSNFDFSRSDHIDMEMLSFQAQLAFAIMESQRHIMETGGYGRPDGDDESEVRGLSVKAKDNWTNFAFDENSEKVLECEDLKPHKNEDPSCCVCLCEYEAGEMLTQLKCGHVYHKECIESWCTNHVRCPLCNLDLEEGVENGSNSIV